MNSRIADASGAAVALVLHSDEIRRGNTRVFEGYQHGNAGVSFFLVNAVPGGGPKLHRHPYEEVFVLLEGRARFTAGDQTLEPAAGQIVIVQPGVPHKFVNAGEGPLRSVNIHPVGKMITEWLED